MTNANQAPSCPLIATSEQIDEVIDNVSNIFEKHGQHLLAYDYPWKGRSFVAAIGLHVLRHVPEIGTWDSACIALDRAEYDGEELLTDKNLCLDLSRHESGELEEVVSIMLVKGLGAYIINATGAAYAAREIMDHPEQTQEWLVMLAAERAIIDLAPDIPLKHIKGNQQAQEEKQSIELIQLLAIQKLAAHTVFG